MEKYLEKLLECDIFKGLEMGELSAFVNCLKPAVKKFEKNELIFKAGEKAASIGVLLKGEAHVQQLDAAGNAVILAVLNENDYFGEIAAFAFPHRYPADVVAAAACEAAFIPKYAFSHFCDNACKFHAKIVENMLTCLAGRARHLSRRISYLTLKSPRQKTAAFLLEQGEKNKNGTFLLPQNRAKTAEFLNLPRPSLSRELCRLRDEGIIDFDGRAVKVTDQAALSRILY